MGRLLQFLRTIMVGGLLFLVPIVVLLAIGDKALGLVRAFSDPLAEEFPIVSAHTPVLFASVLLIGVCFVLGLLALTAPARLAIAWLENNCLSKVPGYVFLKGAGESALGIEDGTAYPVVLARIEEAWQFGFLVETLEGGGRFYTRRAQSLVRFGVFHEPRAGEAFGYICRRRTEMLAPAGCRIARDIAQSE
jgi:hypothetical protein